MHESMVHGAWCIQRLQKQERLKEMSQEVATTNKQKVVLSQKLCIKNVKKAYENSKFQSYKKPLH